MKFISFIFLLLTNALSLFALDPAPKQIKLLVEKYGNNETQIEDIVKMLGNDYIYTEINVFGAMSNTSENDKMLSYDFNGIKYMFFQSSKYGKEFLYYWEITSNDFLDGTDLNLGMTHNDFLLIFKSIHNSYPNLESYNIACGDIFFKFDETLSLIKIYWNIES